jgi:hypothetical protein
MKCSRGIVPLSWPVIYRTCKRLLSASMRLFLFQEEDKREALQKEVRDCLKVLFWKK